MSMISELFIGTWFIAMLFGIYLIAFHMRPPPFIGNPSRLDRFLVYGVPGSIIFMLLAFMGLEIAILLRM